MPPEPAPDTVAVRTYFLALQDQICSGIEQEDGAARFREDAWQRAEGGGGRSRILAEGAVFEKAGVGFSHVRGSTLPASATAHRPELIGRSWEALGVSVVLHPRNPYVPTTHANVRFFCTSTATAIRSPQSETRDPLAESRTPPPLRFSTAPTSVPNSGAAQPAVPLSNLELRAAGAAEAAPIWWFGGGFDLTPCYGFEEDAVHWHRAARAAVAPFGDTLYPRFKRACDEYFFLPHRQEPRGIGGLFFDDFNELGFAHSFALTRSIGDAFLPAYQEIIARRKQLPFGERERQFQLYRRGRYAEFNLVWDRGTLFGLQSGGRTESILMSLPPLVRWDYDWRPDPGSPEERLYDVFLKPRNWADEARERGNKG